MWKKNTPNEDNVIELELTPEEFKRIMSHLFNAAQETTNLLLTLKRMSEMNYLMILKLVLELFPLIIEAVKKVEEASGKIR